MEKYAFCHLFIYMCPGFNILYLVIVLILIFFDNLAAPRPTLGHLWIGSLTHLMLIIAFDLFRPGGCQESQSEFGFKSLLSAQWGLEQQSSSFKLMRYPTALLSPIAALPTINKGYPKKGFRSQRGTDVLRLLSNYFLDEIKFILFFMPV